MSRDLIEALRAAAAFDATPLPEDLATLHVPFDELLAEEATERELRRAAEANGRIQVTGGNASSGEIFDADALARLWLFYAAESGCSLRKTLQIAHTALSEADRSEADRVGLGLIESSVAAWEPRDG